VLEAHLGWASRELGKRIAELAARLKEVGDLRKRVKETFPAEEQRNILRKWTRTI